MFRSEKSMNRVADFFQELESSDEFHNEGAKLEFALELKRMMEETATKRADLAMRLKVSRPMISKLLRGDANVTIETMVKACRAVGGKLFLKIAREGCDSRYMEVAKTTPELFQLAKDKRAQFAAVGQRPRVSDHGDGSELLWKIIPPIQAPNENQSIAA